MISNPVFSVFPVAVLWKVRMRLPVTNGKKTVGAVENRPLNENRWHYTFKHRFFPDYFQTYGLGFFEYFQLSEDIGAEPLPILNCGLVCQYQNDPRPAGQLVQT